MSYKRKYRENDDDRDCVAKKVKYDKTEEPHHRKQAGKQKKKQKKKNKITLSENIGSIREHMPSLDIPRLPHSPAEVSANWKQLIQSGTVKYETKKKPNKTVLTKSSGNGCSPASCVNDAKPKAPDIWFDDVDEVLIEPSKAESASSRTDPLVKPYSFDGVTKVVGMDCEMVGVGDDGKESILARVSIVNQYGCCVYDKFVRPTERVTDYRTKVSGVRRTDLTNGADFKMVQKEVSDLLTSRVLVGHAVHHDLKVLFLTHPRKSIRDTSKFKPFRQLFRGGTPSLKKLSQRLLGVQVQEGEHNSIQDAQAAMRLYTMHRKQWEKSLKTRLKKKSADATISRSDNSSIKSEAVTD